MLVSRFIDRSIRPLFADGYRDETQITATVLSADGENPPDIPAFIGASAALAISEIPFLGPIARRARRAASTAIAGSSTRRPSESAASDLDLVVAGSRGALVMVEGGAKQVPEAEILAGAQARAPARSSPLIDSTRSSRREVGKPKIAVAGAGRHAASSPRACARRPRRGSRRRSQIRAKHERYAAIAAVEKEVVERLRRRRSARRRAQLDTLAAVESAPGRAARALGDGEGRSCTTCAPS